jgi:hypothetical protein
MPCSARVSNVTRLEESSESARRRCSRSCVAPAQSCEERRHPSRREDGLSARLDARGEAAVRNGVARGAREGRHWRAGREASAAAAQAAGGSREARLHTAAALCAASAVSPAPQAARMSTRSGTAPREIYASFLCLLPERERSRRPSDKPSQHTASHALACAAGDRGAAALRRCE